MMAVVVVVPVVMGAHLDIAIVVVVVVDAVVVSSQLLCHVPATRDLLTTTFAMFVLATVA